MAELARFRLLIGGKAVDALSGATFESQNPYTGEPWAVVPDGGPEDVDAAVAAARAALDGEWGELTGFARAALLHRLGDLVSANAERLARLEVNDSGKLYREMLGQLNAMGGWYHYYAGLADKIEGRQIPSPNPNYLVYTRREPVGPDVRLDVRRQRRAELSCKVQRRSRAGHEHSWKTQGRTLCSRSVRHAQLLRQSG